MNTVNAVAYFFLLFTHAEFMVPILLLGWIKIHPRVFYQASCLLSFSIIVNFALKSTFQIPLPVNLNKVGFAFPSGHMQSAVVLYGWLAWKFNHYLIKGSVGIILGGSALSLHYFGYHTYFDLIGALGVGVGLIYAYNKLCIYFFKNISLYLFCLSSSLVLYVYMHYGSIPFYIGQAYIILIGLLMYDTLQLNYLK